MVCITPAAATAYDITKVELAQEGRMTRLLLWADGPVTYQVELAGPQKVVLHLFGADAVAALPSWDRDQVVAGLSVSREADGASLTVTTRAPGVTVLPFYNAAVKSLSLELGGPLLDQVVVPDTPARASSRPEPAPRAKAMKAAPTTPKKDNAAKAPANPPAAKVRAVRLGAHTGFTRLVLDGDAPMRGILELGEKAVTLRLERGGLTGAARIARPGGGVKGIRVISDQPLSLGITLAGPLDKHRMFAERGGRKLVLDLTVGQKRAVKPALLPGDMPAAAPPAESAALKGQALTPAHVPPNARRLAQAAGPAPAAEIKRSPDPLPVDEPEAPAPALPAPPPEEPVSLAPAPPAAPAPKVVRQKRPYSSLRITDPGPGPVPPEPKGPTASRMSPERGKTYPQGSLRVLAENGASPKAAIIARGKPVPGKENKVRGMMPPVPPPVTPARPKGPLAAKVSPEAPAETAPQPAPAADHLARTEAPGSPEPVLEKLKQAKQAGVETAETPGRRFPQGAMLGPKGRENEIARALFDRAKAALDSRSYAGAVNLFQEFLFKYPKHPLAGEASFRLADAYFYLHERNILPVYAEVMENYQRAVDLYSESDQVPWAFLMMGRAAMLAEEAYKAVGFFELVVEDYPQSEYVPLAMVSRGRAYLAEGKTVRALEEFRRISDRFPQSRYRTDADWGQAQALFALGRYQRASLLLRDMDRRNPGLRIEEPELLYYIGEAEFQLKNYPEARAYFLWALNLMPDIRDGDVILARVGDTYQFEKAYAAAKDIYREVLELYPDSDGSLVARIRLAESPAKDEQHPWDIFQIKATTDAYKTYKEIAEKYANREVAELARLKLGVYLYKKDQFEDAIQVLEHLLQIKPTTVFKPEIDYTLNLAALGLLEQHRQAEQPLALMQAYLKYRSLIKRPNSNQVLKLLAWSYEKNGFDNRAAKLYQTLITRGVKDSMVSLSLAKNRFKNRDYLAAAAALSPAVLAGLGGDDLIEANSIHGRALTKLGKDKRAKAILIANLKAAPKAHGAVDDNLSLAGLYEKENRVDLAFEAYDRALELLKAARGLKTGKGKIARTRSYLAAARAGSLARGKGMKEHSLRYFTLAEKNAPSKRELAQTRYELAGINKALGRGKEMVRLLNLIKEMGIKPWSQMAQRNLTDLDLAERLAQVGK